MLTQFRHYTDEELLSFIRTEPDHLAAEGELVRRVLSEEFEQDVRDAEADIVEEERDEANARAERAEGIVDELRQKLAQIADIAA